VEKDSLLEHSIGSYTRQVLTTIAPVILPIAVLLVVALTQWKLSKSFDYQCGACGHSFSPSPIAAVAPHRFGGVKLLRCPSCGSITWASAAPK